MSEIRLDAVTKRYGSLTVVDGVSLTIPEGEFFTLLGPSGSGKTTTLYMIAGFIIADAGTIHLGGRDVTGAPPRERGLGMVFQNYALFPHLTVFGDVAFPLKLQKLSRADIDSRVRRALSMARLEGLEDRLPQQLSGGQQQRVALARAIVANAPIVLMDEPLGALDKNLRYHLQIEIKEISRQLGTTVVYVTHDQDEALTMSDRVAIMNGGRLAQVGAPNQVYEEPNSTFVAKFLGEANLVPVDRHEGQLRASTGCQLSVTQDDSSVKEGSIFVRPEKVALYDRSTERSNGSRLPGIVSRTIFRGSSFRVEVEVEGGLTILCDVANDSRSNNTRHHSLNWSDIAPGSHVQVGWQAEDARLLSG